MTFKNYLLIVITLLLYSCSNKQPNINNIQLEVKTHDFYLDFIAVDTNNIERDLKTISEKYPIYFPFFIHQLVGIEQNNYTEHNEALKFFLTYKDFRELFDTVLVHYPNTKKVSEQIIETMKYIKYYDSSIVVPTNIYYYTAGLNLAVYTNTDELGIGLDMFLGENFAPYELVGIPYYRLPFHTEKAIPLAAAKAIYDNRYPFITEEKNLLNLMIQKGKEYYFLSKVLPQFKEEELFGYTKEQKDWADKNEAFIYNFFIEQELLYDNSQHKIVRYISEGPSSAGFPKECPGNIGSYIGFKIIQSFITKTNSELSNVLKQENEQTILTQAKYRPK